VAPRAYVAQKAEQSADTDDPGSNPGMSAILRVCGVAAAEGKGKSSTTQAFAGFPAAFT
jgi:hypothetical protein